ncbi:amidase domain-containing protein [bacterium]|nr:amidase domain-containing protein [bacterium]
MVRNLLVGLFIFFSLVNFSSSAAAYNVAAVEQYADNWWYRNNPDFDSFPLADCANFVSQCMIAGGMMLGTDENKALLINGVQENHIKKGGAISTVVSLMPYIENFEHAEKIISTSLEYLNSVLDVGDVIVFGYDDGDHLHNEYDEFSHSAIVHKKAAGEVFLAYHSNYRNEMPIEEVIENGNDPKYTRVIAYHFPNSTETGQHMRIYGTGNYYGDNSLDFIVMDSGYNYEGYIVNNTDPNEQDLVVGENTTPLNGCAHYISAYCTDAHKGIPSDGQTFGQPWTNSSPEHWSYWVRKAVILGNQYNAESMDILSAVWYITDRSGDYNSILQDIGYPEDGPDKNVSGSAGGLTDNSIKLVHNKFNPKRGESVNIHFKLTEQSRTTIKIYTIDGVLVYTVLDNVILAPGTYLHYWTGKNLYSDFVASGIYYLHITTNTFKSTKKICVIK